MADSILADVDASGIYAIKNRLNGKRYVGSAVKISKRWAEHRRDLCKGAHHSQALQRAWNKYGQDVFDFEVLENCRVDALLHREQFYIDAKAEYNICRVAGSSRGIKHTPAVRERMKAAQALVRARPGWVAPTKGRKYSREICERMAAPKRGRKRGPMSAETKAKLSAAKVGISRGAGRVLSDETKQKLREINLGKRKTIAQLQLSAKVEESVVSRILEMRLAKNTYIQIESATGVNWVTVKRICLRERYKWVDSHIPALTAEVVGRGGYKMTPKSGDKVRRPNRRSKKHLEPKSKEQKKANYSFAATAAWARRKAAGLAPRKFSDAHRSAISQARMKLFAGGYKTPERSDETRAKNAEASKKLWQSEEHRERVRAKIKASWVIRKQKAENSGR